MVNTNKILTVSYGTFSCTLEGFDDSFGTMKAIAEYFRDLAADDRYFGAEPPTPDAEMLARIAEREISRRVEAHLEENNIVLRADRGSILPVAAAAAAKVADAAEETVEDAEETAPEAVAEAPAAAEVEAPAAPEVEAKADAPEVEAEAPEPDLGALRSLVADSQPSAQAQDDMPVEAEPEFAEPEAAEIEAPEPEVAAEAPAKPAAIDPDSVAAKLQRIRAVVSHYEEEEADTGYSEDEHAEDFLADAHEDIEAALDIDDETEAARLTDDTEDEDEDDLSSLLDRYGQSDQSIESAFDEDQEEEDAFGDFDAGDTAEDEDEVTDTLELDADDQDLAELAEEETAAEPEAEDVAEAPLRARVIKMKRSEFEALAASHLEEDDEDQGEPSSLSAEDEDDLMRELAAVEAELGSAEDEADAAVSDLVAAFDDADDEDDEYEDEAAYEDEAPAAVAGFEDDQDEDEEQDSIAAALADDLDADEDEDADDSNLFASDDGDADQPRTSRPFSADADSEMGRIFAETDNQLDEETGKGRRNAIAHLRAAVAATKAERGAGGNLAGQGPDTEAYRDDLASVVRPRRPMASDGGHRSRRPETARPAPLKLVAEQRVDIDKASDAEPIRPRRVHVPGPVAVENLNDADSFAEFAETVGANSLPELLEAAAAYLAFVEGREQFSRPQLMTRVRQVEQDDFSREDGLRSFGQLLREGKIVKIKGGRFAASDSISYRPDARYAGE
jgi:hypothetical protein